MRVQQLRDRKAKAKPPNAAQLPFSLCHHPPDHALASTTSPHLGCGLGEGAGGCRGVSPSLGPGLQHSRGHRAGAISRGNPPSELPRGRVSLRRLCWEGTSDGPKPGLVARAKPPCRDAPVALCRQRPSQRIKASGRGKSTCVPRARSAGAGTAGSSLAGLPPLPAPAPGTGLSASGGSGTPGRGWGGGVCDNKRLRTAPSTPASHPFPRRLCRGGGSERGRDKARSSGRS